MLDNIESIAREYIEQGDQYLNGKVGNPFVHDPNWSYADGIIEGHHNPIALDYHFDVSIWFTYFKGYRSYLHHNIRHMTYDEKVNIAINTPDIRIHEIWCKEMTLEDLKKMNDDFKIIIRKLQPWYYRLCCC